MKECHFAYGWPGSGKTSFLIDHSGIIKTNKNNIKYFSLSKNTDLYLDYRRYNHSTATTFNEHHYNTDSLIDIGIYDSYQTKEILFDDIVLASKYYDSIIIHLFENDKSKADFNNSDRTNKLYPHQRFNYEDISEDEIKSLTSKKISINRRPIVVKPYYMWAANRIKSSVYYNIYNNKLLGDDSGKKFVVTENSKEIRECVLKFAPEIRLTTFETLYDGCVEEDDIECGDYYSTWSKHIFSLNIEKMVSLIPDSEKPENIRYSEYERLITGL